MAGKVRQAGQIVVPTRLGYVLNECLAVIPNGTPAMKPFVAINAWNAPHNRPAAYRIIYLAHYL
jgi:hypothetical protein